MQHAIVEGDPLHVRVGVDLDPVVPDVLHREVRQGESCASMQRHQLAVLAAGAVEDDPRAVARLAAQRDAVGAQTQATGQPVMAVGQ